MHVFESAGLGVAPFRFVRIEIRRFSPAQGAPSRPGSSCQYCGEPISECCIIKDASGREFRVGNVCVGKTGDLGLIDPIKKEVNRLRREARRARVAEMTSQAIQRLTDEDTATELRAYPHPNQHFANEGRTLYDWANWMLQFASDKGRTEAAKVVLSTLPHPPCRKSRNG
jgi:hypothetical protein